jgi:hypothetical protein
VRRAGGAGADPEGSDVPKPGDETGLSRGQAEASKKLSNNNVATGGILL